MKSSIRDFIAPVLALLLLSTSSVAPASAQSQDGLGALLKTAKLGNWYVRVHTPDHVWDGRVPLVDDTSAMIGRTRVSFGSMAAIERRHRDGGGRQGAIAGGLALGAAGAMFSFLCDYDCGRVRLALAAGGAAAGAVTGGLIAQAISPGVVRWERVWTAPAGVLARGDTLIVPLPEAPAPQPDNPTNFGTYVGGVYFNEGSFGSPLLPAVIGVVLSRDYEHVEVIMLDVHASRVVAGGALGAMAGANLFTRGGYYIGGTAGVISVGGSRGVVPVGEVAIGATDRSRSRVRLELTFQTDLREFEHTVGYVNLGYTIR